jgi:hypothetical protein
MDGQKRVKSNPMKGALTLLFHWGIAAVPRYGKYNNPLLPGFTNSQGIRSPNPFGWIDLFSAGFPYLNFKHIHRFIIIKMLVFKIKIILVDFFS